MNLKQCVRENATLFRRSHIHFANFSLTRRSRLFAVEKSRPGNFKHQKVTYTAVFIVGRGGTISKHCYSQTFPLWKHFAICCERLQDILFQ